MDPNRTTTKRQGRGPLDFLLRRGGRRSLDSAPASLTAETALSKPVVPTHAPPPPPASTKPASDVLAGALARAASQSTIHPLDTIKVRIQAGSPTKQLAVAAGLSKTSRLIPPAGAVARAKDAVTQAVPGVLSLYKGVLGAASGAGIAIGAYFACYGVAHNIISTKTQLKPTAVAFSAGALAAAGSSVVKVPLAVCIRSVQAGVYTNVFEAAGSIVRAAGVRGLFTGYLPTVLEDVPDMAFKFAAYESLRSLARRVRPERAATPQEDFAMGLLAGAFAAAATTPLDVVKTNMMVSASSRPSMASAALRVWRQGGMAAFFGGVQARALSQGMNSAIFFCFFEALSRTFKQRVAAAKQQAKVAEISAPKAAHARTRAPAPQAASITGSLLGRVAPPLDAKADSALLLN
ncbi:unnamed protein product [Pedinophyceae sp. YPF-701]|nr:unnamed protein product [Pedinophyceae sp. YPF-701]